MDEKNDGKKKIIIFEGVRGIGFVVEKLINLLSENPGTAERFKFLRARDFPVYQELAAAKQLPLRSLAREEAFFAIRLQMVMTAYYQRASLQKNILLHRGFHSAIFFDEKSRLRLQRRPSVLSLIKQFYESDEVVIIFIDIPPELSHSGCHRYQYLRLRREYLKKVERDCRWRIFKVGINDKGDLEMDALVDFLRNALQ